MSEIVSKFHSISSVSESFKKQIKLIYVFDDNKENKSKNVILVTKEDQVFALGGNSWGGLGFGHKEPVGEPRQVPDLSHKGVVKFANGLDFALAITRDSRLLGWGLNERCQLSQCAKMAKVLHKPTLIATNVKTVTCGHFHSVALLHNGSVIAWGDNSYGQLGVKSAVAINCSTVKEVACLTGCHVTALHCQAFHSLALTMSGRVFAWGFNNHCQLGLETADDRVLAPALIETVKSVKAVASDPFNTYFLTDDAKVWFCGKSVAADNQPQKSPKPIQNEEHNYQNPKRTKTSEEVVAIHSVGGSVSALTDSGVHHLLQNFMTGTHFKTFLDYYASRYQLSHSTINLEEELKDKNRVLDLMSKAFNNQTFSDLKFKVRRRGTEDAFDVVFCHKAFVANTEYFRAVFANQWSENISNEIEIKDYSYEAVYHYIKYLYSNSIGTREADVLLELLQLSDQYLDDALNEAVVDALHAVTDVDNVCDIYSKAVLLRAERLEKLCLDVIDANRVRLLSTQSYRQMTDAVLIKRLLSALLEKG